MGRTRRFIDSVSNLRDLVTPAIGDRRLELKSIQELLDAGGLRHPSDLDLLLFFYRHPHVLLTLDHLAAYTGYDLQQVAKSLDLLVGAGLLRRKINETHSREMYLVWTGDAEEWLQSLLRLGLTRDGRMALTWLLRQRESPGARAKAMQDPPLSALDRPDTKERDHASTGPRQDRDQGAR